MQTKTHPAATSLPNLLIVGSAKSGTTSVYHYLDRHPEISMAAPLENDLLLDNDAAGKEMRFFWREDWRERTAWYRSHFAGMTTPVRGEATPAYSAHPFHPGVAERVHSLVPNARLLYIVRDPIERIVSHYVQQRADGDSRSFEQRMAEYDRPENSIVCPSLYATQIERYLALFPTSQLLVVDQHKLRHERQATLHRIFAFLEVDPDFWTVEFDRERNLRADKYALTPLGGRLLRGLLDPAGRRLAPRRWSELRPRVRRALSEKITDRPIVEGELREKLSILLQPEVDRLRELTGEQFDSWSL
ncbi:MAG TPA: sulfotransferase [Solirubrobacteraceae bacterium]